ncbi:hypothetical protein ACUOCP_26090, partial [Escherichia sp. R-CC3]
MLHTMPSYTERIQEVLPHAKIIRLIGYTNGNKEYQKAKCAAGKWQTTEVLQDEQIHAWIQKGGWKESVRNQKTYRCRYERSHSCYRDN